MCYQDFVYREAAAIGSDGCTLVSELYHWCCLQHDLCYFYARDPRGAYAAYKAGQVPYWPCALPLTKQESDQMFRRCMQDHSPMGWLSPVALVRWLGVKLGGSRAWAHHRRSGDGQ